ncbi:hypothetical protein QOZ80_2AG0109910 [Eleusine coracana subsp. coracana]|nr:hypothetical protein QOZ80_2AG0109910 [Eleusine coracana subsp. coracana]
MGCASSKQFKRRTPGYEDPNILAKETTFSVNEVEALYELYKKISNSIFKDGIIHKEEFQLALFRNSSNKNLFADRMHQMILHAKAFRSRNIWRQLNCKLCSQLHIIAFRLYDLRCTGFIEREELKELVIALLNESDLFLSEEAVEQIVDQTFKQADANGDGKIDPDEWKDFACKNPALLRNMTLPYLKDITVAFPSFVLTAGASDDDL